MNANYNEELTKLGYEMEQSISGYWRLLDADGYLIYDDSACEDVYDEESAYHVFLAIIEDRKINIRELAKEHSLEWDEYDEEYCILYGFKSHDLCQEVQKQYGLYSRAMAWRNGEWEDAEGFSMPIEINHDLWDENISLWSGGSQDRYKEYIHAELAAQLQEEIEWGKDKPRIDELRQSLRNSEELMRKISEASPDQWVVEISDICTEPGYVETLDKYVATWDSYGCPSRDVEYTKVYVALFIPKSRIAEN